MICSTFPRSSTSITRREFNARATLATFGLAIRDPQEAKKASKSALALAKTKSRQKGVRTSLRLLGDMGLQGKNVYLKASFDNPRTFPATTHPETLSAVVEYLRQQGCAGLTLVERSDMGATRDIWDALGVTNLAGRLNIDLLALDEIPATDWRREIVDGWHWKHGVEVPNLLRGGTCIVQISNLTTHRFGAMFRASLENSLGLIAKFSKDGSRYNYMEELHASPDQLSMIAEVNQIYSPKLVVMDATQVFISGGPEAGDLANPEVVAASRDRVALDAIGVALLRLYGVGFPLNKGAVFDLGQLKRAGELGLGATSVSEIDFLTADEASSGVAGRIAAILKRAPDEEKA